MVIAAVNYTGEHETIYIARAKRKNTTAAALHRPPPSTHTTPAAHSTNHATILDTFTPRARTKRENRGRPRAVAASTPPPPPPPPPHPPPPSSLPPSSSDCFARAHHVISSPNLPLVAGASAVPGDAVVALAGAAGVAFARVAVGAEVIRDASGTRANIILLVSAALVLFIIKFTTISVVVRW